MAFSIRAYLLCKGNLYHKKLINVVNILCMLCIQKTVWLCKKMFFAWLSTVWDPLEASIAIARLPSCGHCYATTHREWLDQCEWLSVFFSQLGFGVRKFLFEKGGHQLQIPRFLTYMRHVANVSEQFSEILYFSSLSKSALLRSFKEYQELPRTEYEKEWNMFEYNCL